MMIVKYCKPEHNAHSGSRLLVGNLEKYKNIENDELVDSGEGTFKFSIEFLEGAELSTDWANLLFQGQFSFGDTPTNIRFPGRIAVHVEDIRIAYVSADRVVFEHAKAEIEYSAPNALIFCTSISEGDPRTTCPFEGYSDYWRIGADQISLDQFAGRLGSAILQQMCLDSIDSDISNFRISDLKNLNLNVRHDRVKYVDRNLVIEKDTPQDAGKLIETYLDVPFCKPKSYSPEREYRFVFTLHNGNRIFPVKNKDLFLDLNLLTAP